MERYRARLVRIISNMWRVCVRARVASTPRRVTSRISIRATIQPCVMQAAEAVVAVAVVAAEVAEAAEAAEAVAGRQC
ncbi:hypothetical protein SAMN05443247_07210 [Bradyrhizobium erythrophlei]|nr:hypothetical protein SAMN05443247_07210 [Bradyrhizobium erythrophlei]